MASSRRVAARQKDGLPPHPFKRAAELLDPFYSTLSEKHFYIAHIDTKPKSFKKKIFAVPVLMNVAVVFFFMWRLYYIGPYYLQLLTSALGYANETTLTAKSLSWGQLIGTIFRRAFTFFLDSTLSVFVWPWPVDFFFARGGNPAKWRWIVGFRDQEIYVRRSRDWDRSLSDILKNAGDTNVLLSNVRIATSPMLLQEKTGYLTMNGQWDLDWEAMCHATSLVDSKTLTLDTFRILVLVHHEQQGWMTVDIQAGEDAEEDNRRRQVYEFREALTAAGKEDLFFRWIEIIQFESSQPGGFGPQKQAEVAAKVRELFQSRGVDFDEFWKDNVGSRGLAGL